MCAATRVVFILRPRSPGGAQRHDACVRAGGEGEGEAGTRDHLHQPSARYESHRLSSPDSGPVGRRRNRAAVEHPTRSGSTNPKSLWRCTVTASPTMLCMCKLLTPILYHGLDLHSQPPWRCSSASQAERRRRLARTC